MRIKKVYLADEIHGTPSKEQPENIDYELLNTDVIVQLDDENTYRANFITLKKLAIEFNAHCKEVAGPAKKYFWTRHMVIIDTMKKKELTPLIEYMIEEGDFQLIFEKL